MGYTDAQGRPELVVNPQIKLGLAEYRTISAPDADEAAQPPVVAADPAAGSESANGQPSALAMKRRRSRR